jgi:hypothetical protein
MQTTNGKDQEEPHEIRIGKIVSNIRAYLKDNLSIVGQAHPGDIRTIAELRRHLKHASDSEIREALTLMSSRNLIRFREGSEQEFVVNGEG